MIAAMCAVRDGDGHEAGRQLLQTLYEMQTGQPLPPIRIAPGGKPFFDGGKYHFSITHTRHHAFCVLAESPVGIDAEELDRNVNLRHAGKILSPMELEQLKKAQNPKRAFLTFWVLKEAEAKFTGRGLRGFPNHTEFLLSDARVREWDGCLVAIVGRDDEEGVAIYAV